ncbi:MAG TPA: carboxypeptidase regulatory-like domain-containing protein, partial [Gemmatimonadaceae bacterium]|nr:carboxypeptidase regulatory-like domain-containing protein [Gemmatimonadaceae bacterium]
MGAGSLRYGRRLLLFLGLLAPCGAMHAQRIRGDVLLADSATRAAGMIVVVSGAAGETIARALTGAHGDFDIALPRAARYAVRVLRIGYQPTLVPPFDVAAGESHALRIVLNGAPVVLARVTVRGESSCRLSKDSGQLVARVWDEARKAMTASQLGAMDVPLVAQWIEFERTLSPDGRVVRRQLIRSTRGATTHAFVSLPGDSLAQVGYVVAETDGTRYFAPDADALLSESFAALHCFHVEPGPSGHANLIGVGFRPAREREGMRDIEGTFWLDRETAELRWLDYRYTGLHAVAADAGAGGRVEFLRLASGNWLINRWHIRMPILLAPPGRARNPFGTSMSMGQPRLRAIEMDGGEVTLVLRKDSVVYRATGATLLARITSGDTLVGTRGGVMTVDGTNYGAPVDSTSVARLTPVLAGPYHVRVRTASMESMGAPPAEFDVEVKDGPPREVTLTLPGAVELLRGACGEQSTKAAEALLYGTVRDTGGRPVADSKVTVSWQSRFLVAPGGGYAVFTQARDLVTDGLGRWRLCGVPRTLPVTARLVDHADDQRKATAVVRLEQNQPLV